MILYKYTSLSNALNILLTQQIRYTQPIAFNDPFEVSPITKTKIKDDFIKKYIGIILGTKDLMDYAYDKTFKPEYDNLNANQKSIFPFELYSKIQKTRIENELKSYTQITLNTFSKNFL